jgi:hypothetical protein
MQVEVNVGLAAVKGAEMALGEGVGIMERQDNQKSKQR